MTTVPEDVVFDAEPLIAHATDEPGSDVVETFLDAVAAEDVNAYVNFVNLAEVRYTLARKYGRETADEYVDWLRDLGIEGVGVESLWSDASDYVFEYNPALGDSFALATADTLGAMLIVGGDDDYDEVSDVPLERFRDGSA
ncbi:PIN domain-containing protein [Natrarchaeobaculum aegyptiacum]|uniref:VapC toxin family PIN domain ribonuclease n=1 Tax=Natrarchaeobaculum aegyptiacum TaxID=745377 RepID=A0A2Z2HUB4_9EURY|nr:PIN domain-containing protein [Natrarchaeobaculum aegyptiacum]ARS90829.1 VapC toxin family PIN domain ribonuclease [Natrarchaeobaculum aegyptiacum]